jgi:hypothetical protein
MSSNRARGTSAATSIRVRAGVVEGMPSGRDVDLRERVGAAHACVADVLAHALHGDLELGRKGHDPVQRCGSEPGSHTSGCERAGHGPLARFRGDAGGDAVRADIEFFPRTVGDPKPYRRSRVSTLQGLAQAEHAVLAALIHTQLQLAGVHRWLPPLDRDGEAAVIIAQRYDIYDGAVCAQ